MAGHRFRSVNDVPTLITRCTGEIDRACYLVGNLIWINSDKWHALLNELYDIGTCISEHEAMGLAVHYPSGMDRYIFAMIVAHTAAIVVNSQMAELVNPDDPFLSQPSLPHYDHDT